MVQAARAIREIIPRPAARALPQPARRLNLQLGLAIADRLLGKNGMLPNTRLGAILASPFANDQAVPISAIIRQVLSFDRKTHLKACEIITGALTEVEAMSEAEVVREAQKVVDELYRTKSDAYSSDANFKSAYPAAPTVRAFAEIEANGHFDVYQYFISDGWGKVSMTLDYGRVCGYDQAISTFDLRQQVRDAYVMTRALEIL
jgi:hypothetical protein